MFDINKRMKQKASKEHENKPDTRKNSETQTLVTVKYEQIRIIGEYHTEQRRHCQQQTELRRKNATALGEGGGAVQESNQRLACLAI